MSLAVLIVKVLRPCDRLTGRDVATLAGIPYKATIDALCRMHNSGQVIRVGSKSAARWTLKAQESVTDTALAALEAVWRGKTPHPPGGEVEGVVAIHINKTSHPSKIFQS